MVKDSKYLNFVNEIHMNEIIFLCCLNPEGWHLEARGSRKGLVRVGDAPWLRRFKCFKFGGTRLPQDKIVMIVNN